MFRTRFPRAGLLLGQVAGHRKPLSYLVLIENDGLPAKVTGGPSSVVWQRYFEGLVVVVRAVLSIRQKLTRNVGPVCRTDPEGSGALFQSREPRKRGEGRMGF